MGKVFGAYTDIPWQSSGGNRRYYHSYGGSISGQGNTFVFSLREDSYFVKLKCLNKSYEV